MADFKRAEFLKELDGKILPLTTVSSLLSRIDGSCLINMPIRWDISRFVWKYSKLQISDRHLKLLNVGIPLSRRVGMLFNITNE